MQTAITPQPKSFNYLRVFGLLSVICLVLVAGALLLDIGSATSASSLPIYDAQVKATIVDITVTEANPLYKGSILDHEGYLLEYTFGFDGKSITKTEFIESTKSEEVASIQQLIESSSTSIWVQYDSNNPNVSKIDFSRSIAAS